MVSGRSRAGILRRPDRLRLDARRRDGRPRDAGVVFVPRTAQAQGGVGRTESPRDYPRGSISPSAPRWRASRPSRRKTCSCRRWTRPCRCAAATVSRPHPPADDGRAPPGRLAAPAPSEEHRDAAREDASDVIPRARVLSGRARSRARTAADAGVAPVEARLDEDTPNASDEDARSIASDEDSDGDFTSGSFLTCSAARGDVAALGRLFAETYAPRGGRVTIDALPPSVRSATRRMLSRRPPTAAAIRDSTLFPPRIRSAAKALAAIRDAPAGIARVEAAAEALAGGEGDVEALVAPAAAEALRDALRRAGEARTGSDEDANDEASSRAFGVAVGAIIARVARRAPARVSRRLLPSLISSTLTGDAFPASRALDAARRETLDPAVLRAARLVLGDAAYRAKIQPAVIACLTPTGSEASKEALNPDPDVPSVSDSDPDVSSVSSAAAAALAATVADAGSLPAALRDVVRPLVAALGDGPGVIDAIARVNAVLDAPAVVRHVLPALERLVGPVDAHLPGCGARNPSEDGHSRATAAEHRGERDAVDDAVGSDDARGVDASYASSEATAVREGWSRAPRQRARSRRPPRRSPRRRARSRRWRPGDDSRGFPSRRRRSRLPSRAETAGTAPLVASPPDAVPPHAPRRGGRRRHRGETRRREKGGRDGGAETRTALRLRRRGCQKRTRDGIVRIVRRSAGGARGGSRAVPRPRGRVRFPRASRRHARVGGDRGETRKMVRVGPVARRARFPTPAARMDATLATAEPTAAASPGTSFSATASKIGRGMSGTWRAASAAANVALLEQMRGGWRRRVRAGVSDSGAASRGNFAAAAVGTATRKNPVGKTPPSV